METCTCEACGATFELAAWAVRRGRGKYCSHACYAARSRGRAKPSLRKRTTKACVVCGTAFETGGRAGSASKNFCSVECRRLGRYRTGRQCADLAPLDAAYLAGFWDGEGCFILHRRSGEGSTVAFRAAVVGTKESVIRWVKAVTGIGTLVHRPSTNPKWAERWEWWVNGDGAESFTRQLLPYLKLKAEQARMGIDFQARLRDPALKADRAWQEEWRLRMRELNRRGPALDAEPLSEVLIEH